MAAKKPIKVEEPNRAEAQILTDSAHWNRFALEFLCEVRKGALFPEEDLAIALYRSVISTVVEHHSQPVTAERMVVEILQELTEAQRLTIYRGAYAYLQGSEFGPEEEDAEPFDMKPVLTLIKVRMEGYKGQGWTAKVKDNLKDLVRTELERLPETLSQMDPKDRATFLSKLLPFVMAKAEERPSLSSW